MDLLQLEHFLAVVEERTFTRAAERVCRTQPAVSQIGRGGRRADSVRDQARHERRRDGKHRLDDVRPDDRDGNRPATDPIPSGIQLVGLPPEGGSHEFPKERFAASAFRRKSAVRRSAAL
ncbi:MAG: hypothetical protein DMF86_02640 [Acidobacteria bacterium]|nr:MAG: hypothetical protein DMF86_02640 [Acidobacteriota bacterium]